jgi:hypothetical protein
MGQEMSMENTDEVLASVSVNPTPQQGGAPGPLNDDKQLIVPEALKSKMEPRERRRADSGKLHRVRHGILSREALNALVQAGEDRKTFRRLERQYREALRPVGPFGDLFFDRFWSAYLKLILVGRLETQLLSGKSASKSDATTLALVPGHLPTLVSSHADSNPVETIPLNEELPSDLLRGLVLAQRYDRHHSREMYRSLALLLMLRRGGEPALEDWAREMLGSGKTRQED